MSVKVEAHATGDKGFVIVSEEGSKVIRNRVFHAALDAEEAAQQPNQRSRSAISPDNYSFALLGEEDVEGYHCFVLQIQPKRKDTFLLRGRVWIDAEEYAVVRLQGELSKPPSFWTRRVQFIRQYGKLANFWVPVRDESVTEILIFGKSTLTIAYGDYELGGATNHKVSELRNLARRRIQVQPHKQWPR